MKQKIIDGEKLRLCVFSRRFRLGLLTFVFLSSFGLRIYYIHNPPLDFHPSRQYFSVLKARSYYYDYSGYLSQYEREFASVYNPSYYRLEPPVMEFLASSSYLIVGGEKIWIPRFFSSVFWIIGGLFLYFIAQKITSADTAIFASAIYLFFPFGILASRSFQPDPMVIMGVIISLYLIFKYYECPSQSRVFAAAIAASLTILFKGIGIFMIVGAFFCMGLYMMGLRKFLRTSYTYLFLVISLLPSLIYYSFGFFINKNIYLLSKADIVPQFLLKTFFWKGLMTQIGIVLGLGRIPGIGRVLGYLVFSISVIGVFMFRKKISNGLIFGMWIGYVVFCLVFSYTSHTHDYWHLQLLPLAALSLAPILNVSVQKLNQCLPHLIMKTMIIGAFILVIVSGFFLLRAKWKQETPRFKEKIKTAQEIGAIVTQSQKTLFLSEFDGLWLKYHGKIWGKAWPTHWSFNKRKKLGKKIIPAEERLFSLIKKHSPEFFIVTFIEEFDRQEDLKNLLYDEFPLLIEKKNYLIFDLRRKKNLSKSDRNKFVIHSGL